MSEAPAPGRQSPALVLLHGFGGLGAAWGPIRSRLPSTIRVIALDLPGHGEAAPVEGRAPAKAFADAALVGLDRHGIRAAHWAGHSLGGAAAMLAALSAPERVLSLTLLSPGGLGEQIASERLRAWAEARWPDEIAAAFAAMAGPDAVLPAASLEALARDRARPGRTATLIRLAEKLSANNRQGVFPVDRLAALPVPVNVLWGTDDPVLPFNQARALPASWVLHAFEGRGHMLIEEAAEQVAALLTNRLG